MIKRLQLPVLNAIKLALQTEKLSCIENTIFICVQHLLFTTVSLVEVLIELGAKPSNIFINGKSYSACSEVIKQLIELGIYCQPISPQIGYCNYFPSFVADVKAMWGACVNSFSSKQVDGIVILDDGGTCLANIPDSIKKTYPIVCVEQTSAGVRNNTHAEKGVSLIDVAFSAAKQLIESPLIADSVIHKLEKYLPINQQELKCGVIGLGVIGRAISQKLDLLGHKIITFDNDIKKNIQVSNSKVANSVEEVLKSTSFIFGCTGADITKNLDVYSLTKDKTFISCSSQDKEFYSLLKFFQNEFTHESAINVFEDICFNFNEGNIKILRGGFPINLDNSGSAVSTENIQLTRGLLLGGIVQAIDMLSTKSNCNGQRVMLYPEVQKFVVKQWINYGDISTIDFSTLEKFSDINWIANSSKGEPIKSAYLKGCFNNSLSKHVAYGRDLRCHEETFPKDKEVCSLLL